MKKEKFDSGEWSVKRENYEILVVGDRYVARVFDWCGYNPPASKENAELHAEAEANARLIAAAPDMLEACKMALQDLYYLGAKLKSIQVLEAAIKKSLGE